MATTKEDCKQVSAEENNFDSFDRAIRYTFNRPLLESEYQFIHKITYLSLRLFNTLCKHK